MKKLFKQIILLLIFTSNFANAQLQDLILQKIIDNKLIEPKQIQDFEKSQNRLQTKNTTSYLYGLFQCEYKSTTGNFFSEIGSNDIFDSQKLTEEQQKKENENLTDYLLKLKKCELLTEKQKQYFQQKINDNSYSYKLQFISDITFKAFKADYMAPHKLKEFADHLKEYRIVDTKYQDLITAIDEEKIKEPIDFLLYCEKATIIDPNNYSNKPEEYLEAIHKQTASLLPELAYTDFEFKIISDDEMSSGDSNFLNFIVSIRSNGKVYKQKSFYKYNKLSENDFFENKIDYQKYYQIFNKILNDLNFAYRLHVVPVYNENKTNQIFGIMALDKEQGKILSERISYIMPYSEDFKNKPTSQEIENALEEFTKNGLFSNLTADEIERGKEVVAEMDIQENSEIVSAFPNLIYSFDTELGNLEDPYAELVKEFAKISDNEFNPSDISNQFDFPKKKKTTLKFKLGNKSYSKTLKIDNDWIDFNFFDFIKSVVNENNLKGQFYKIYTGDQIAKIVYLTKNQYNYFRANKLLLFTD
ncbi:hypothetical protein J0383_00955 [Flavobacterium endoglycinae]|uniref:Uncharacterized protein n=1 Tax=Flavobacterium endoglycinae TaxID=2816357 RepID=A0ABX7QFC7_9FLAO|nr:hypothetical protein [Flavobacterium endoglycinae]QSW89395.1 hypothetical protein J0383_00955 [Flavobacterium endoglycinae]